MPTQTHAANASIVFSKMVARANKQEDPTKAFEVIIASKLQPNVEK